MLPAVSFLFCKNGGERRKQRYAPVWSFSQSAKRLRHKQTLSLTFQILFIPFPFCFRCNRLNTKLSFSLFFYKTIFFSYRLKLKSMEYTSRLSYLMRLSWEVQRTKKFDRSRSLRSAWAIILTEEITVFHLVRKYRSERNPVKVNSNELSLFIQ